MYTKSLKLMLSAGLIAVGLGACSNNVPSKNGSDSSPPVDLYTTRLCDREVKWNYDITPDGVADAYRDLMGVWKGEVHFLGGGSMCIAVIFKSIKPDGIADAIFVWNLTGDSTWAADVFNVHSEGTANWPAQNVELENNVTGNYKVLFEAKQPYRGRMYKYIFGMPHDGKMNGVLQSVDSGGEGTPEDVPAYLVKVTTTK